MPASGEPERAEGTERSAAADPDGAHEPTGSVTVEIGDESGAAGFTGTADFVSGGEDFSIRMMSEGENRVLRMEARGVIEDGRPDPGRYELQRNPRGAGYSATYVDRRDDGAVFNVTSGTLRITSVTAERIEGDLEFAGDNPFSGEEIDLSARFDAVCMTYAGTGERCF